MIKNLFIVFFIFFIKFSYSQTVEVAGLVTANDDVENIHVINKTANKFATTNSSGQFYIQARVLDTIVFSSIQYKLKALVVTSEIIEQKSLIVELEENVNSLNEVIVGRVLTRNLESDIENSLAKPKINFYDLGIPGYKGKPLTKREREYADANNGKIFSYYGIGFGVNFYKLLNTISGRTKRLKNYVRLEKRDEAMFKIRAQFSEMLLAESKLTESQKNDYFFFCSEDEKFEDITATNNELLIFQFLQDKYKTYLNNLNQAKD